MDNIQKIISNTVFVLLSLITIVLVFEDQVVVPFWLQPIGRMHPLMLHFPIGFIVLLVLVNLFRKHLQEESFILINRSLLLLTALTTVLAALMGLFLSFEDGYSSDLLTIHKWLGIGVAYIMYLLILVYKQDRVYKVMLYSSFLAIVFAGHFGAGLTHGMNFLTEPLLGNEEQDFDVNQTVFVSMVQPILKSKCENCHNPEKHKGELDLSSPDKIHIGGKNGPLWVAGNVDSSHIIQRALLPLEHKKHMPPKGKTQLSSVEISLLKAWISKGANEEITLAQLSETDTLFLLAQEIITHKNKEEAPKYTFDFADEDLITSLNNPYRTVVQKAPGSPAIDVTIYGKEAFKSEYLTDLESIKDQVVSLNLSYMPVGDEVFDVVSKFSNLEMLNLNFTDITGEKISLLNQCKHLKSLSLSGTSAGAGHLANLKNNQLEELYVWNTSITPHEVREIATSLHITKVEYGYTPNPDEKLTLPSPVLLNDKNIISRGDKVVLVNKINGVQIRYTEDGTEPDSTSAIYRQPLSYDKNVTVKARSYQVGWLPSEIKTFHLIQKGVVPKSIELIYPPGNKYTGGSELLLIDDEQGKANELPYLSWAGFFDTPFSVIADLGDDSPVLEQVAISYGAFERDRAIQPSRIEVWGGDEKENLHLITAITPEVNKKNRAAQIEYLNVPQSKFRYYQLIAYPVDPLPKWHKKKGQKGTLLIDQIFFYEEDPRKSEEKVLVAVKGQS